MPKPKPKLKALTVRQPWAWCITDEAKRVENRIWQPRGDWRGPLALHAAQTLDTRALDALTRDWGKRHAPRGDQLALGAIVGLVRLADVHPADKKTCPQTCRNWGEFPAKGAKPLFHWILDDVTVLRTPLPCKGALQLWNVPDDVAAALARQTRRSPAWKT